MHGHQCRTLHRQLVSTAVAPGRWAPGQIGQVAPENGPELGPGTAVVGGTVAGVQRAVLLRSAGPAGVARLWCQVDDPRWNPWPIRGCAGRDSCVPRVCDERQSNMGISIRRAGRPRSALCGSEAAGCEFENQFRISGYWAFECCDAAVASGRGALSLGALEIVDAK